MTHVFLKDCPHCSVTARLRPEEISLNICQLAPAFSFYAWACPECLRFIYTHAGPDVISLLVQGGVTARPHLRSTRPSTAPLTEEDLLAFGLALEATDDVVSAAERRVS